MADPFDKPIDWLTGTTATTHNHTAITAEQLIASMQKVMKDLGEEPLAKWMHEQGCPPESWTLILPAEMRELIGPWPPRYVQFSTVLATPCFIRTNGYHPFGL
jgi:hypothetical protein